MIVIFRIGKKGQGNCDIFSQPKDKKTPLLAT
jgi:hypothetical protein